MLKKKAKKASLLRSERALQLLASQQLLFDLFPAWTNIEGSFVEPTQLEMKRFLKATTQPPKGNT